MYCSKCGKELDDDAIFCNGCGCVTQNFKQNPSHKMPVDYELGLANNLATIGIICGIFVPVIGLICGIVGLSKINAYIDYISDDINSKKVKNRNKTAIMISVLVSVLEILIGFLVLY